MNAISTSARRYRSIWISDIHLGTRGCKADLLLDFLRNTESDYLYLVGDIFDIWRMRKNCTGTRRTTTWCRRFCARRARARA